MDDWKRDNKRLEGRQVIEFKTDRPLSPEELVKLVASKEDWMERLEVEEVV